MTNDLTMAELKQLGAMRLTEWLTRPQAHLAEFTKPFAERAGTLLYPAIAGAFHDNAISMDVLVRSIDLAYLQDIVDGDYPYTVKLPAQQAVTLVSTLLKETSGHAIDPYAAYDDALYAAKVRLRALKKLGPDGIPLIQTTSDAIHDLAKGFMASKGEQYPVFPFLIWKGQHASTNRGHSLAMM